MTDSGDRIEKQVILRATRARVWRAISNATEFGEWFRVRLEGEFRAGASIHGRITYPGYEQFQVEMQVQKIAQAFRGNDEGWTQQAQNITRYVAEA